MAIPIGVIAISLFLSAAIIRGIARHYRKACASAKWPTVPGTLLESEIKSWFDSDVQHDVFTLKVRYAYEVAGARYESNRIGHYFGADQSLPDECEHYQRIFTRANPLLVYVNPADPRDAVLLSGEKGMPPQLLVVFGVMSVVCPIAAIVAIYWFIFRDH